VMATVFLAGKDTAITPATPSAPTYHPMVSPSHQPSTITHTHASIPTNNEVQNNEVQIYNHNRNTSCISTTTCFSSQCLSSSLFKVHKSRAIDTSNSNRIIPQVSRKRMGQSISRIQERRRTDRFTVQLVTGQKL
jgi:hypothetical protein